MSALPMQHVTVYVDVEQRKLTLDPPQVTIGGKDAGVAWTFLGIPNTWIPCVRFHRDGSLGPFLALRTVLGYVLGEGLHHKARGRFSYRTSLFRITGDNQWEEVPGFVAEGRVEIALPLPRLTALDVLVTVDATGRKMHVEPERVSLWNGDVLTWHFAGLQDDWYPVVFFRVAPGAVSVFPHGPFDSLTLTDFRRIGGERLPAKITGEGNLGFVGEYRYDIWIYDRASDRPIIRLRGEEGGDRTIGQDPTIDNNGPVIGGPGN